MNLLIIFSIATGAVFISGCSKKGEEPTYSFTPNQTSYYRFWMTQQMESAEEGFRPQRFLIRFTLAMTPKKINADKSALIAIDIADASAVLSTDTERQTLKTFNRLDQLSYRMTQLPCGQITGIQLTSKVPQGLEHLAYSLPQTFQEMLPVLPERLSEGTAWSSHSERSHTQPPFGEIPSKTTRSYELVGPQTIRGTKALAFRVNYDFKIGESDQPPQAAPDKPGPAEGETKADNADTGTDLWFTSDGSGQGLLYFNNENGRFAGAKYDTRVQAKSASRHDGFRSINTQTILSHIEVQPLGNAAEAAQADQEAETQTPEKQ